MKLHIATLQVFTHSEYVRWHGKACEVTVINIYKCCTSDCMKTWRTLKSHSIQNCFTELKNVALTRNTTWIRVVTLQPESDWLLCNLVTVRRRFRDAFYTRYKDNRPESETASTNETPADFCQTARRNNPEDSHLHARRRDNLKSHSSLRIVPNMALSSTSKFTQFPYIRAVPKFAHMGETINAQNIFIRKLQGKR
jgi:hypothetical protein